MDASLIVCTRNRSARLAPFLASVSRIEYPTDRWELLLVDHASSDDTAAQIAHFAERSPIDLRTWRSSAPHLVGAKNEAIAQARGDILVVTDDDCYPRPDYLRRMVEVFAAHPVGIVGGRVTLHNPTDAHVSIRDVDRALTIEPETFVPAGLIHGANLAMTSAMVRKIGGFDPLFGPGTPCIAAEDLEIVARAVWSGWRARYDPGPAVAHDHGRKPGPDTDRHRQGYDYGRGAYYAKYLLDDRARRVYLRHWLALTRRASGRKGRGRVRRELAGAARYVKQRALHFEPIPQFSRLPMSPS